MSLLSTPTIEELISSTRYMLSQPDASNSTWTDDELAEYLNEAVRRYFTEVVNVSEGQFTTTADLNIADGSELVTLPDDFFRIKNVWRKVSGGYQILHYRNTFNEGYSTQGGTGGDSFLPSYYFRGNKLVLRPVPNFSETAALRIEYVQFPETMVTGGDELTSSVSPVFKDLIVAYAVYKAKLKESLGGVVTYTVAKDNLNDLFVAFKQAVTPRSDSPTAIKPWNPEFE